MNATENWLEGIFTQPTLRPYLDTSGISDVGQENVAWKSWNQLTQISDTSTSKVLDSSSTNNTKLVLVSRTEFENEINRFRQTITSGGASFRALNRDQVAGILKALKVCFANVFAPNNIGPGGTESLAEEFYKRKIQELESEKKLYQNKIKNHGYYISDLEKKVNTLIDEYEETNRLNREYEDEIAYLKHLLKSAANTSAHLQTPTRPSKELGVLGDSAQNDKENTGLSSKSQKRLVEVESELEGLKKQLSSTTAQLKSFEQSLKDEQMIKEQQAQSSRAEIQEKEKTIQQLLAERMECLEQINSLKKTISTLQQNTLNLEKENGALKEAKGKLEKDLEFQKIYGSALSSQLRDVEVIKSQILHLTKENERLQLHSSDFISVLRKTKRALSEILPLVATQNAQPLTLADPETEAELDDGKLLIILKQETELQLKTLLEAAKRVNAENVKEKSSHAESIEKYENDLRNLEGKVKIILAFNERIALDMEKVRTEFQNYRIVVHSIWQELNRLFDGFHKLDQVLMVGIKELSSDLPEKSLFELQKLAGSYELIREGLLAIEKMLNERSAFL